MLQGKQKDEEEEFNWKTVDMQLVSFMDIINAIVVQSLSRV